MNAVVLTGWAAKTFILGLLLLLVLFAGAVVWIVTAEVADWLHERKLAKLRRQDPEDET